MLLFGVSVGVATTTIYAVAGSSLPPDAHATGFGIMTTASLLGLAVSPVVAGFIGGTGLRMVFVADVVLLVVVGVLVCVACDCGRKSRTTRATRRSPTRWIA